MKEQTYQKRTTTCRIPLTKTTGQQMNAESELVRNPSTGNAPPIVSKTPCGQPNRSWAGKITSNYCEQRSDGMICIIG